MKDCSWKTSASEAEICTKESDSQMTEEKLVVCAVILLAAICILGAGLFIFSMEQVDDEEAASFEDAGRRSHRG